MTLMNKGEWFWSKILWINFKKCHFVAHISVIWKGGLLNDDALTQSDLDNDVITCEFEDNFPKGLSCFKWVKSAIDDKCNICCLFWGVKWRL